MIRRRYGLIKLKNEQSLPLQEIDDREAQEIKSQKTETPKKLERVSIFNKGCIIFYNPDRTTADIYIYGVIRGVENYIAAINFISSGRKGEKITIHIHSPGGDVYIGCLIITAMQKSKATIITHNMGSAMSCGSLILSFGDKIYVDYVSISMFHNGIGGIVRESFHHLVIYADHGRRFIIDLFDKMVKRGLIKEEEASRIVNGGEEYFLKSDEINKRLIENDIIYEEDE